MQNEVVLFGRDWWLSGSFQRVAADSRIPKGDILRFGLCVRWARVKAKGAVIVLSFLSAEVLSPFVSLFSAIFMYKKLHF